MGLNADLTGYMLTWQDRVFKGTPTVPQLKRAWQAKQFAWVVYLAGLKKGMDDAYNGIRKVWIDGVAKAGDYEVGTGGKQEGIWFVQVLQEQGIWQYKGQIPKSIRIATDYWNVGKLWEAIYLAGVRRGWIMVYEILIHQTFQQSWRPDLGFPE